MHRSVVIIAIVLITLGVAAATVTIAGADTGERTTEQAVFEVSNDENETPPHRHPDEYLEDGDLLGLQGWLGGFLAAELEGSVFAISEEEYELARSLLGEEYLQRFSQYVEVNRDTDRDGPDDAFDDARDEQERLADLSEAFDDAEQRYEDALAADDATAANEAAREMVELADAIEATGLTLIDLYALIDEAGYADLSEGIETIEALILQVIERSSTIAEVQLTETVLTIETDDTVISFTDPLEATGHLQTADGEPVASQTIQLELASGTITTATDAAGNFSFTYRPVVDPIGQTDVVATYRPAPETDHLPSDDSVRVEIGQVEPTLANIDIEPTTAYFGESVTVTGELLVDDIPVGDVPLEVAASPLEMELVSAADGSFSGTQSIGVEVPTGLHEIEVILPFSGQALAGVTETAHLEVGMTHTELSIDAEADDDGVTVSGRLTTDDGAGIAAQEIDIFVAGHRAGSTTTDDDGYYLETVAVPDQVSAGEETIAAYFDGEGTNLATALAETRLYIPATLTGEDEGMLATIGSIPLTVSEWIDSLAETFGTESAVIWVALGLVVLVVLAIGWLALQWYRDGDVAVGLPAVPQLGWRAYLASMVASGGRHDVSEPELATHDDGALEAVEEVIDAHSIDRDPRSLRAYAEELIEDGMTDEGVMLGYAVARDALTAEASTRSLTHTEFLAFYEEQGDNGVSSQLTEVTDAFETAAFAPSNLSETQARTALERVDELTISGSGD